MAKTTTHILSLFLLISVLACQSPKQVSETTSNSSSAYSEPHRPQFHFTPASMWMNDPNGMVFYEGEYHLFYQHYPEDNVWGPMHWGHAVSEDLVNWEHLPIALYPDSLGYIFSGSAVVDWENTSGLGKEDKPPLIAIFTHHDPVKEKAGRNDFQYQSIAYSNDKGRNWTTYEGNPVIPNQNSIRDFRDPKVIWDEDSEQWVMVFAAHDHVKLYGSPNLKDWTHLSDWGKNYGEHGGVWECPDLFSMEVEGSGEKKWVLLQSLNPGSPNGGSGTQYFVGEFDGKEFIPDPSFLPSVTDGKAVWLDYGRDNYAGVTWSDIPKQDGRRIFLGWMSNWDYANIVPTEAWRSAMTLPRELVLKKVNGNFRLFSKPVEELKDLRANPIKLSDEIVEKSLPIEVPPTGLEVDLEVELLDEEADFGVEISNSLGESYRIGYDGSKNQFYSDRTRSGKNTFSEKFGASVHHAPRIEKDTKVQLTLFFDRASVELFADKGAVALTDIFFPTEDFTQAQIYVKNGKVKVQEGEFYPLTSIWQ